MKNMAIQYEQIGIEKDIAEVVGPIYRTSSKSEIITYYVTIISNDFKSRLNKHCSNGMGDCFELSV